MYITKDWAVFRDDNDGAVFISSENGIEFHKMEMTEKLWRENSEEGTIKDQCMQYILENRWREEQFKNMTACEGHTDRVLYAGKNYSLLLFTKGSVIVSPREYSDRDSVYKARDIEKRLKDILQKYVFSKLPAITNEFLT